jgi:antirestriction protein
MRAKEVKNMVISKKAERMSKENGLDPEVNQAYIELEGEEYATAEDCAEAYRGQYSSDEEFVQELLEQTAELPFYIHIDWEAIARDVMMDYSEYEGYYFRNL